MSKSKKAAIGLEPNTVTEVPLIAISPDPDQPRKTFSEASLLALADNIRERGIQQPLLTQHDKLLRPAILADLYQGEIEEPFRPWRPGDEDPDYDEDGDYFPEEDEEKAA